MSNYRLSGFSILPPVIKNLIIINALCFAISYVMQSRFNINLNQLLGVYYPGSVHFRPFQFVTHIFMHADLGHLVSNMFSLWIYGAILENFWGGKKFLTYYMITAFGAALLHIGISSFEIFQLQDAVAAYTTSPNIDTFVRLIDKDPLMARSDLISEFLGRWQLNPDNPSFIQSSVDIVDAMVQRKMNIPTVGASGAVFGLMLGAALLFPNTIVFPLFIPLKYIAIIHGVEELYYGFMNNPMDSTAHFAHLGGMLFGFILIKFWNKTNRDTFY
jgi:membrane associated rhomboid family serine protease